VLRRATRTFPSPAVHPMQAALNMGEGEGEARIVRAIGKRLLDARRLHLKHKAVLSKFTLLSAGGAEHRGGGGGGVDRARDREEAAGCAH